MSHQNTAQQGKGRPFYKVKLMDSIPDKVPSAPPRLHSTRYIPPAPLQDAEAADLDAADLDAEAFANAEAADAEAFANAEAADAESADAESADAESADAESADAEAFANAEAAADAEAAMSSELMDAEVTLKRRREEIEKIEQAYMRADHTDHTYVLSEEEERAKYSQWPYYYGHNGYE